LERILTTKEATVQTVQVEIQTLRVSKKQVTMGLFRQLPYERLVDPETVQLCGVPWGHVNYWWEGDGRNDLWMHNSHRLHVVWQLGETLRRAVVYEKPPQDEMDGFRDQIQGAVNLWFLASLPSAKKFAYEDRDHYHARRKVLFDDRVLTIALDMTTWIAVDSYWQARDLDPQQQAEKDSSWNKPEDLVNRYAFHKQQKETAIQCYRDILQASNILDVMPDLLMQHIRGLQTERDAYKDAWVKQWQTLSQLPQLFIAV
jgi:hypothetical protein